MVRITGHLNIKLSMLPGPGFGKSGQAVDGDNVDPVLNGEVWFGGGRHPRLHPGRVHRLLPNGHLSQSLVRDKKKEQFYEHGITQNGHKNVIYIYLRLLASLCE